MMNNSPGYETNLGSAPILEVRSGGVFAAAAAVEGAIAATHSRVAHEVDVDTHRVPASVGVQPAGGEPTVGPFAMSGSVSPLESSNA
jgi:hypothetical protein